MTQTDSVTTLRPDANARDHEAIKAFDNLHADYLAAVAKANRWCEGDENANADAAHNEQSERVFDLF